MARNFGDRDFRFNHKKVEDAEEWGWFHLHCGFSKTVFSRKSVKPWLFVTFNILIRHIFPGTLFEVSAVVLNDRHESTGCSGIWIICINSNWKKEFFFPWVASYFNDFAAKFLLLCYFYLTVRNGGHRKRFLWVYRLFFQYYLR